ncbi:hypothetical protein BOX15_Mlig023615g1 [Macrostomum lignano]|uniref:BHLH domain-containing protein n=1 Tax=Macrostomum lignano TaxID=282301 RepID=A0A267ESQ7_9PLAT|nr:hypothetical protein BOX15_Mlig023615g1 [Macrostomum lignano]
MPALPFNPVGQRRHTSLLTTGQLVQGADGDIYVVILPQHQQQHQQQQQASSFAQLPPPPPPPLEAAPTPKSSVKRARKTLATPASLATMAAATASTAATAVSRSFLAPSSTTSAAVAAAVDRRLSHNEVERRRRDKINALIGQLAELMPPISNGQMAGSGTSNGASTNCCAPKSAVLDRAVAYFDKVRREGDRLTSERDCLRARLDQLESKSSNLRKENAQLRQQLGLATVDDAAPAACLLSANFKVDFEDEESEAGTRTAAQFDEDPSKSESAICKNFKCYNDDDDA